MIDLTKDQLASVKKILLCHVPGYEVRAFGSRVKGGARPYSDLDLAIVGTGRGDSKKLEALREAFENSELPFRVDVIDWNETSEDFRNIIGTGFEVIDFSSE